MEEFYKLNSYITPTIQIHNESNEIYVKREDLLPFSFGGNKIRFSLEFIRDMYNKNCDCIIGYGNARSNLNRALANLCYKYGIPYHVISPADDNGKRVETFNNRIVQMCNAEFHCCQKSNVKEAVDKVLTELKNKGFRPYYIYGDSEGKGNEQTPLEAYNKVYDEIKGKYDYIFLATGTGITQAGLLAGKARNDGKENIIGISVARSAEQCTKAINEALKAYSKNIKNIPIPEVVVDDSHLCGGYGKYNSTIGAIIRNQMIYNGMPLDPTYTGKAFWGMRDYLRKNNIRNKKILFIHTGGSPLFFDYEREHTPELVNDVKIVKEAIAVLGDYLSPSLTERNIDIDSYADKLNRNGKVWCHMVSGVPVSIFGGYFNDYENHIAYCSILVVSPKYRFKHLGTRLFSEVESYAMNCGMKAIKLEVRKNNSAALKFHENNGYKIIGNAGTTSYYMQKDLYE